MNGEKPSTFDSEIVDTDQVNGTAGATHNIPAVEGLNMTTQSAVGGVLCVSAPRFELPATAPKKSGDYIATHISNPTDDISFAKDKPRGNGRKRGRRRGSDRRGWMKAGNARIDQVVVHTVVHHT